MWDERREEWQFDCIKKAVIFKDMPFAQHTRFFVGLWLKQYHIHKFKKHLIVYNIKLIVTCLIQQKVYRRWHNNHISSGCSLSRPVAHCLIMKVIIINIVNKILFSSPYHKKQLYGFKYEIWCLVIIRSMIDILVIFINFKITRKF